MKLASDATQVDRFFQEVRHFALYSIVVPTREPVVEKTIKFVAALCTYPAGIPEKEKERREKENQEKDSEGQSEYKLQCHWMILATSVYKRWCFKEVRVES